MAMAKRVVPSGSWRKPKAQIAPAPKKMNAKVPMNSAASFWGVEYMEVPPGRPGRILAEEGEEKQRSRNITGGTLCLRNGCCVHASVEKKRINTEDTEARAQRAQRTQRTQRRRKRFNTEGSERGEYRGHGRKRASRFARDAL